MHAHTTQYHHNSTAAEDVREVVLVHEDIVVRGAARAEQPAVALQVEVELRRVRHVAVDDGAGGAVAAAVALVWAHGEEPDVVPLADHDHRDGGHRCELELVAGLCRRLNSTIHAIRGECTFERLDLDVEYLLELPLGNTV